MQDSTQPSRIKPHVPSPELGALLSGLLASSPLMDGAGQCPEGVFANDDFASPMAGMLLAADCRERHIDVEKSALTGKEIWKGYSFIDTPQEFIGVANDLALPITRTSGFYFPRDHFIRLCDGSVARPYVPSHLHEAILKTRSAALYWGKTSTAHTNNQLFNAWGGYSERLMPPLEDLALFASKALNYSYIEGGNLFSVTNGNGEIEFFLGEDNFFHTFLCLNSAGADWNVLAMQSYGESFENIAEHFSLDLPKDKEISILEEMFALSLVEQNGKGGIIPWQDQLNLLLLRFMAEGGKRSSMTFREMAIAARLIEPFDASQVDSAQSTAAGYLAKKHIVHALMAQDLLVKPGRLHLVPQVSYHLDCFLTPAPGNAFFITSYALLSQMLAKVEASAAPLALTPQECERLVRYRQTAQKLDRELSPLLMEAQKSLEAQGKRVIPLPQHVVFEPGDLYQGFPIPAITPSAYFGNAITGYSNILKSPFYIAHGLHPGDRLATLIIDVFAHALSAHIPGVQIYFLASHPSGSFPWAESADAWGRIDTQSGIHCATFHLAVKMKA
jgi:hypothetical protein